VVFTHVPSPNRRARGVGSLYGVAVSVVLGSLVLAGCSTGDDQTQPLTLQAQSPTDETPTGDPAASDTASPSPEASDGLDPTDSPTAPTARPSPHKKPRHTTPAPTATPVRTVKVTKTVPASTGVPTPSPTGPDLKTVVAAESTALKAATAVHVAGTVVIKGEKFDVDLHLGTDGEGTLTSPDGVIRVRRVGTKVFLNVDGAFFTLNKHPELAVPYQDKWMPIDPGDPAHAVLLKLTQVATWTTLMAGAPVSKAAAGSPVGGTETVALTGGTGDKGTTVLVPAKGDALPLLARSTDKVDQIAFDTWNAAPAAVQAPTALKDEPADTVVDIPAFATETAAAFAKLWVTTPTEGL